MPRSAPRFQGDSLIYLPIFGSDASSLAIFQPGVSPEGAVAGAMYDQNTFQLDGGNNSNDMDGSMTDYTGSYAHGSYAGMPAALPAACFRRRPIRLKNSK